MTDTTDLGDVRSQLALVVSTALGANGYRRVVPSACYAVADAILARPGMLRAALDPDAIPSPQIGAQRVPCPHARIDLVSDQWLCLACGVAVDQA